MGMQSIFIQQYSQNVQRLLCVLGYVTRYVTDL